jgi:release factor glutamine methyltransferase
MRWRPTSGRDSWQAMTGDGTVTWRELWAQVGREIPRHQARWVCEVASGAFGDEFVADLDSPATQRGVAHLDAMLARLRNGEPLQYVLGQWSFRRIELLVDARVLIPRPETELVVEEALRLARSMPSPLLCADLGCGSGAIGLSLAAELPYTGTTVWLTDVSAGAIAVARANAAGVGRNAANVRIAEGSWFEALPAELRGCFDLVVSNPPYIAEHDVAVENVVSQWEPHSALYAGDDGLDAVRAIAEGVADWLRPGGWLVLEIGAGQGEAVHGLLDRHGLRDVAVLPDLAGHDRIVTAVRE